MNASCQQLSPGCHLVTHRRGYDHHGIYLGNGRVIHYAGRMRYPEGLVEEVTVAEFCRGRALAVAGMAAPSFDAEEIVRRARSRLGEQGYRVLSNNCEHFCSWCIDGQSRSPQVDRWMTLPRRVAGRAASLAGVLAQAFGFASSLRSFSTVCE